MLRVVLSIIACLALAGCWVSDQQIFGKGDWAHLDFNGKYLSKNGNGDVQAHVTLRTLPSGLITGTSVSEKDGKSEKSTIGLVPITGGSGKYFIAVDRTDKGGTGGDIYLIAHLTDDKGLEMFWPECAGTAPVKGMTSQIDDLSHSAVCKFTTKQALMEAGLQAEKFLSVKHVVEINPFGQMVPDDGSDDSSGSDSSGGGN